jgi:spoIIIJ-associated protein
MAEIEVEGKTVEEAIEEGLAKLGCTRDKIEIKILNEGTAGLFGLMGNKPARVRLTTKNGADADFSACQEKIKDILSNILNFMHLPFSEINTALMAGRLLAEIKSPESSFIIGKNGQTLEALEHIATLILNKDENTRIKITLNTEGYRKKQEKRIHSMAQKAAEQVKRTGKAFRFEPMSAKERRIIHLFLQNDPDIETLSEGEDIFRKVVIKPKK